MERITRSTVFVRPYDHTTTLLPTYQVVMVRLANTLKVIRITEQIPITIVRLLVVDYVGTYYALHSLTVAAQRLTVELLLP
jgi:hypothetical protein